MNLYPFLFRPSDATLEHACDWAMLAAIVVARQSASPTARAQARLAARAVRPGGAFAGRVAAALRRPEE